MAEQPQPQREQHQKPPRRHWHATYRRIGLTQGINIALTVALVFVGCVQIWVYLRQAHIMRGQLALLQNDATIRRNETIAKMGYHIDTPTDGQRWGVTVRWTNVGKTDASAYWGWDDFNVFHDPTETKKWGLFLSPMTDFSNFSTERTIEIPDEKAIYHTHYISKQDALDVIDGKAFIISWGYVEYADIFGTFYTARHCHFFEFETVGQQISITLPHQLYPECMRRTEATKQNH